MKVHLVSKIGDQRGSHNSIDLSQIAASGGAGDIYLCEEDQEILVKVYRSESDRSLYEEKVISMVERPPILPDLEVSKKKFPQVTWPRKIAISPAGDFLGFSMTKMDLNECVSLERFLQRRMRQHEGLPEFYGHRISIAHNLAVLVDALHAKGHHVIDLKPQNCFVHRSKLFVSILDSDGMSISGGESLRYPATQYTEEYIAPESMKKRPSELARKQDLFALAVIIFRLLNNGIHPFQSGARGPAKTIHQMVERKRYAYGLDGPGALIPNGQSIHEYFPNDIRESFDKAFRSSRHRPEASEWRSLLQGIIKDTSGAVSRCDQFPEEHLDLGLGCGMCRVQARSRRPVKTQTSKRNFLTARAGTPKSRAAAYKGAPSTAANVTRPSIKNGHSLRDAEKEVAKKFPLTMKIGFIMSVIVPFLVIFSRALNAY